MLSYYLKCEKNTESKNSKYVEYHLRLALMV